MHGTRWIEKTERSALALRSEEYRLMAEGWGAGAKQAPPDLPRCIPQDFGAVATIGGGYRNDRKDQTAD